MTLGFALVLALVYLAWLLDRVAFLVPAFVLSLAASPAGCRSRATTRVDAGLVLEDGGRRLGAHLRGVALDRRRSRRWPPCSGSGAPQLRRQAFMRFSRLATVLIALVLAAGIYLSIVRLPHLADLWSQGYGQVLLVKIGLVCVRAALGRRSTTSSSGRRSTAPTTASCPGSGRSLVGESLVGIAVLLVAAVLVDSRPPREADRNFE